jgi:inorganic pyrophosphatase
MTRWIEFCFHQYFMQATMEGFLRHCQRMDAFDVLMLGINPTHLGILIEAGPIGLLGMKDGKK